MNEFDKTIVRAINRARKIRVTDFYGNTYSLNKEILANSIEIFGILKELNGNKVDKPIGIKHSNIKELELIF